MAIELKQSLRMSQQLLLTPQLQQAIKLLQLSRAELVEEIQKELVENPVLEEGPESEPSEQRTDSEATMPQREAPENIANASTTPEGNGPEKEFDWANYVESSFSPYSEPRNFSAPSTEDLPNYENMVTRAGTLQDHLEWQLNMSEITEEEREIGNTLIGNMDDNGYLAVPLAEISEKTGFSVDALEDTLCLIQDFDPPGVGASDLKTCLMLQVRHFGQDRKILEEIINNHLHFIERRDYDTLARKLGVTLRRARELAQIVFNLDPKPGRAFNATEVQYVTPDISVKKVGDDYVVILNEDGMPKLQISNLYKSAIMKETAIRGGAEKVLKSAKEEEAQNYIQDKLKSALWLIKSIHQRQKTLYKVTKSIVSFQRDFLDKGINHLKPLVLRDVADEIGVHESTVSRATNGKYVHTPQGIFELKYFFNAGIGNRNGGEDFANESVKQMVRGIVSTENPKSPLSDQAIVDILKSQNIDIARRTVAKYREILGILPSSRRKRLN